MKKKNIGIILIVLSIFFLISTITIYLEMETFYKNQIINSTAGACFDSNGSCIHENPLDWLFTIIYIVISLKFFLGIFLIFLENKELFIAEKLHLTSENLKKIKEINTNEKTFEAFLKGFNEDEKNILKEIKKQDGIWQSTLRIKTGLTKSTLSIILTQFEKKGYISKVKKGKTFEIYSKY